VRTPSHCMKGVPPLVPDVQFPLALVQEMVPLYGPQSFVTVHDALQSAPAGAVLGAGAAGVKIAALSASRDVADGSAAMARSGAIKTRRGASRKAFFMGSP
jgi:hypothetical protein